MWYISHVNALMRIWVYACSEVAEAAPHADGAFPNRGKKKVYTLNQGAAGFVPAGAHDKWMRAREISLAADPQ